MLGMGDRLGASLGVLACLAAGCHVYDASFLAPAEEEPVYANTGGSAGEDAAGPEAAVASDAVARADGAPDADSSSAVPLPFAVDSYFIPSGYMGDATVSGAVDIVTGSCKKPRPTGAQGNCYQVTYRPQPAAGPSTWAGIYWLHPANNWGTTPGLKIAPGATQVGFYAAGQTGTESVTFRVGGVQDDAMPHKDTLRIDRDVPLSASMVKYAVVITGQTYDEVLGGFGWIVTVPSPPAVDGGSTPIVFYLDDIKWE